MPVHVNIPIRIRLKESSLSSDADEWLEQLERSVGKAIDSAGKNVLSLRGSYVTPHLSAPSFVWHSGFSPETRREKIEEKMSAAIARVARASPSLRPVASTPRVRDPQESADPTRLATLVGLYQIPGYDGGGAPTNVPVTRSTTILPEDHLTIGYGFIELPDMGTAMRRAIDIYLERHGSPESTVEIGFIARIRGVLVIAVGRMTFRGNRWSNGHEVFQINEPAYSKWEVRDGTMTKIAIDLNAGADYAIETLGPAITLDQRRDILSRHLRAGMLQNIINEGARLGTISEAEIQRQATLMVDAKIDELAEGLNPATRSIINVRQNGMSMLQPMSTDIPSGLSIPVFPIREEIVILRGNGSGSGRAEESGTDGPGGDGERGSGAHTNGGESTPFPSTPASGEAMACAPFRDEPNVTELASGATYLKSMIDEIAAALQIDPCYYAANFTTIAATQIGSRAWAIAELASSEDHEAFSSVNEAPGMSSGRVEFRAVASPAIQFMRVLARIVPLITAIGHAIPEVYRRPANLALFPERHRNEMTLWELRFRESFTPALRRSVGYMFVGSCRIVMQQSLNSSLKNINQHLSNRHRYAGHFAQLISVHLVEIEELQRLQLVLKRAMPEYYSGVYGDVLTEVTTGTWYGAFHALAQSINPADTSYADKDTSDGIAEGEIVGSGANKRIRDQNGRLWSMSDLNQAIQIRRGLASSIDPLVNQIVEDEELLARFKNNPNNIEGELFNLLYDMFMANYRTSQRNRSDPWFAFRASQINDLDAQNLSARTIARTQYALGGIHAQVHLLIGEFFHGDPFYGEGVSYALTSELGRQGLIGFFTLTGVVLLGIACAPLALGGAVVMGTVGLGMALVEVHGAGVRRDTFRGLINPEEVASRAEVEAQEFAAYFGLALSIMPYAGKATGVIGRPVFRGVAARIGPQISARIIRVAPDATRRALATISRVGVARAALREAIEQLERSFFVNFAMKMADEQIEDAVINRLVMNPVIQEILSRSGELQMNLKAWKAAKKVAQMRRDIAPARITPLPPSIDARVREMMESADEEQSITLRRVEPQNKEGDE